MGFFKNLFGGKKDDADDAPFVSEDMLERQEWSKEQWQDHIEEDWGNIWDLDDEGQKCSHFDKNELLKEIKNNKEVVLVAVSPDNGGAPAYRWASEELKKDPDVIAATKKGNLADDFDEDEGLYL